VLHCEGAESNACLTGPQLAALTAIYGGMRKASGQSLFPGLSPGGEAEPGGWGAWVTGDAPEQSQMYFYGTQFFRNMVYNDPKWSFHAFDPDRSVGAADDKLAAILNATNPDLTAFRKRGGRLILYHGWADPAIPALSTVDFFKRLAAAGPVAEFARLYMAPGMEHCGGGAGPNIFGQAGVPHADARHDIDAALEAWVEAGTAPDAVIATKSDRAGKVVMTRPLCPWPAVAKWDGHGNIDDAASFSCTKP
jgi:feruloyl esterase